LVAKRLDNVYGDNMSDNGNSVNIESKKQRYHHGDLRSAVVEQGLKQLETGDAETLSLREIARNVGVSATAIYRHFPDKGSLLKALAEAGYAKLGAQQVAASAAGGPKGFAASGQAYVRFALDNPDLFRLMFASTPYLANPKTQAPEGSAAGHLHRGVVEIMGSSATPEAEFVGMMRAWSLVHGLAMLILDQQLDRHYAEKMIAEIVSADSVKLG
jgi:AcrR family transcriptional regulator